MEILKGHLSLSQPTTNFLKKLICITFLLPAILSAQNYVDLVTLGYSQTFNNSFEELQEDTNVISYEVDLTLPLVLNDKHTIVSGALFSRNHLQLAPNAPFTSLYSTTLKVGLASTWNEKWSTTVVALPKIASDYKDLDGNDFLIGGIALLKFQKKDNLIYKFGLYGSQEHFGFFTVPIVGWYYMSPNNQFEMDMSLPVAADINYTHNSITYGVDYSGIGRSFNIDKNNSNTYVDMSSLEFASYVQFNLMDRSLLLKAKLGYSSNAYELYPQGETIDLGLAAFTFGDKREPLNPNINGSLLFKVEAVYRFNISEENE